ncbi:MAG TPA: NUDIX domain-containing protein [Acidobacteriota bacterium]|nr:NUDIX domain-containing protein [Acidobacteriota bacterium]
MNAAAGARCVTDIGWTDWEAVDRATLLFVVNGGRILLIRKKRGLGAGKINAPGGRLEAGESWQQAAIREVEEEVCVVPGAVSEAGELRFQFVDGYSIHVRVFRGEHYAGEPRETDEATPLWFPLDAIPYTEMWADDILWLPLLLQGKRFTGRFVFSGDALLDHRLETIKE